MRLRHILINLLVISAIVSCNKDDFNYAPDTVGISKVIYFPAVTINGDRLIILNEGDAYTDAGAQATLNGDTTSYTTTGEVNTSVPGIYDLTYTAVNEQGYTASDWRTVVVIGNDVANNDFSGTYLRAATGVTSTWTKTANGVYMVENPGGASVGAGLTVIAVNYTGDEIAIPHQISPDFGEVSSQSESYDPTSEPPSYEWIFIAGGYGTSPRDFTKQ